MMLTLVSRGNLWFTKWVGNNRLIGHWCTALLTTGVIDRKLSGVWMLFCTLS